VTAVHPSGAEGEVAHAGGVRAAPGGQVGGEDAGDAARVGGLAGDAERHHVAGATGTQPVDEPDAAADRDLRDVDDQVVAFGWGDRQGSVGDRCGEQLRGQAVAGGYDIAAAIGGLRADLARMTTLANATTAIDAALAAAADREHRRQARDHAAEDFAGRRVALAAAHAEPSPGAGVGEAATAIADYVRHEVTSRHQR